MVDKIPSFYVFYQDDPVWDSLLCGLYQVPTNKNTSPTAATYKIRQEIVQPCSFAPGGADKSRQLTREPKLIQQVTSKQVRKLCSRGSTLAM